MKYLLDTHTFIWMMISPQKLSEKVIYILQNESEVYASPIVLWEISIKYGLGKIELNNTTPEELWRGAEKMGIVILPLNADDAASFYKLEKIHKDPFDRMLVWQSLKNDLILLSKDNRLKEYEKSGLQLIW